MEIRQFQIGFKTGDIYDADFCYRLLPDELDKFDTDTFASNPLVFYMVATDVETGEPVYYKCTDGGRKDLLWMRASASMPIVSKPVPIDGKKYLDGGISDSIPVHFMEQQKYDRIAVILTQPAEYRKKASALQPLMNLMLHRYPAIAYDMKTRAKRYNDTLDYICAEEKRKSLRHSPRRGTEHRQNGKRSGRAGTRISAWPHESKTHTAGA